jgi:hypothetical protein
MPNTIARRGVNQPIPSTIQVFGLVSCVRRSRFCVSITASTANSPKGITVAIQITGLRSCIRSS